MIIFLIVETILLTGSFFGLYYFKTGSFIPQDEYLAMFVICLFLWIFFSLYYKKYKFCFHKRFLTACRAYLFSMFLTLFFTILSISIFQFSIDQKSIVLAVVLIPFIIEVFLTGITHILFPQYFTLEDEFKGEKEKIRGEIVLRWLLPSAFILILIFIFLQWLIRGEFLNDTVSGTILLLLFSSWGLSVLLSQKYRLPQTSHIYYQIAPFIKSGIMMQLFTALLYFLFNMNPDSILLLFSTSLMHAIVENIFFLIYFIIKKEEAKEYKSLYEPDSPGILGQKPLALEEKETEPVKINRSKEDVFTVLNRLSPSGRHEIIDFLKNNKKLMTGLDNSSLFFSTASIDNLHFIKDRSLDVLMNFRQLNDMRRLNEYLITCHAKIIPGGYLIGNFKPMDSLYGEFRRLMPKFLFIFIYPLHFLFYRVFPKLPKINQLYFVFTKGINRVLSKPEVFGRLSFCGFEVIDEREIGQFIKKQYFIARLTKTVSTESSPSYGPIVKLKRIGYNGEKIIIHKFRTMYPYSEFLQKDIFEKQDLDYSGKIKDDFRLTIYGKILRKLWLDEIPQIYDWMRGTLNIFGVRALSEHFFSLYPPVLRKLRIKFKPGLVPPYYVDLPKSFEEIIASELKYLKEKEKNLFITDLKYFSKAFINIVFKGIRSK